MAKKKTMAEKMGIKPWEIAELDANRVKEGVSKMREVLAGDTKKEMERGSSLPPDRKNLVFKVVNLTTGQVARDYGAPPNAHLRLL